MTSHVERILIQTLPFDGKYNSNLPWNGSLPWPCQWIGLPANTPPFVAAYCLRFSLDANEKLRVHVTADERYELYLVLQPQIKR